MIEFLKYLTIYFASMFKFILGPTMGVAAGLPWIITVLITTTGGLTTTAIFLYLTPLIRKTILNLRKSPPRKFSKRNRGFVKAWNKFGLFGVSFLTPILFSTIGGAIIVSSFGEGRKIQTLTIMGAGTCFWAICFTLFFDEMQHYFKMLLDWF